MLRSIEFVASPSSSINVLPWLMASVTGVPARQVVQFAQLASSRGDMPPYHNDLAVPVLGSDVLLAGEKPARRVAAFKNFPFPAHLSEQVSGGGGAASDAWSFSHEPLLEDDDAASELSSLAAGEHVSIRAGLREKYGVFDKLPKSCPSSAALAGAPRDSRGSTSRRRVAPLSPPHHGGVLERSDRFQRFGVATHQRVS